MTPPVLRLIAWTGAAVAAFAVTMAMSAVRPEVQARPVSPASAIEPPAHGDAPAPPRLSTARAVPALPQERRRRAPVETVNMVATATPAAPSSPRRPRRRPRPRGPPPPRRRRPPPRRRLPRGARRSTRRARPAHRHDQRRGAPHRSALGRRRGDPRGRVCPRRLAARGRGVSVDSAERAGGGARRGAGADPARLVAGPRRRPGATCGRSRPPPACPRRCGSRSSAPRTRR